MDDTAKEVCLLPHEKFRTASLINQSIKIYIVLLKAPYSEVHPTLAKRKWTVFKSCWNWEHLNNCRPTQI